jgi:SAM-dependent methyltransferase
VTAGLLVRAASPRVVLGASRVFLLSGAASGGPASCALEGDHAALVLAVLDHAGEPRGREAIVARVLAEAGADASQRPAVDQAIDLLLRFGALVPDAPRELAPAAAPPRGAHVVLAVTGAVGASYAPALADLLLAVGHEVRVAMTRSARRFISRRTFEAVTHRPVATSLWRGAPEEPAPHIALARWADVVVIYPCSATTLGRLAAGDCSEIVSAVATSTRAPVLLAPSMNTGMLEAPAVAENLERLRERGFHVAYCGAGVQVADTPAERVPRRSVAPLAAVLADMVSFLLEQALTAGPCVPSAAEWEVEHARHEPRPAIDDDLARALDAHAPLPARILEVGAGLGDVARAAASRGHAVVATDASTRAIERAVAVDPTSKVTWVVDDATSPRVQGSFDVAIDRGCLGCIPVARRARYCEALAERVRPGGVLLLKTHLAPARNVRAFGFTREEVEQLFEPWFSLLAARASTLDFGDVIASPALLFDLRRRG